MAKENHKSKKIYTGQRGRNGPTHPRRLIALKNETTIMQLRMAGANYHEIGEKLGITYNQAYLTVRRSLARLAKENAETAGEIRDLEAARYDRLMVSWWPRALGSSSKEPDPKAAQIVMDIIQRRCKLFGADAPNKIALTESDGSSIDPAAIRDELVARFTRLLETDDGADCGSNQDDVGSGCGGVTTPLADLGET